MIASPPVYDLTKLEVAQRQLETAIRLFLSSADPIAIHALAAAAHEVLWDLGRPLGILSLLKDNPLIRAEDQPMFSSMLVEAGNFLKHADRDPNAILKFRPETTEFFIFDAIEIFRQLTGMYLSPAMATYTLWFATKRPSIFRNSPLGAILPEFASLGLKPENKMAFLVAEQDMLKINPQSVKGPRFPVVQAKTAA